MMWIVLGGLDHAFVEACVVDGGAGTGGFADVSCGGTVGQLALGTAVLVNHWDLVFAQANTSQMKPGLAAVTLDPLNGVIPLSHGWACACGTAGSLLGGIGRFHSLWPRLISFRCVLVPIDVRQNPDLVVSPLYTNISGLISLISTKMKIDVIRSVERRRDWNKLRDRREWLDRRRRRGAERDRDRAVEC
jgi:hypothetical protein